MNNRILISMVVALSASACSISHGSEEEDASVGSDARACVATFDPCRRHDDCCAADYCSGPYGPSVCTPSSPDGSFCVDPRECASATCVENVCGGVVPSCLPAGAACSDAADQACCDGTRCRPSGDITVCLPPGPDGDTCADAADCATGVCTDGTCGVRVGPCLGLGDFDCRASGASCCDGFSCEQEGYYEGYCVEMLADGAACSTGFGRPRCASGNCTDGMCRAESCVAVDVLCGGTHEECCAGFCDFGFTYGPGVCRAPQPAGQSCYDGRWCVSGECGDDGLCR